MKVAIAGASGFLGTRAAKDLSAAGHDVKLLRRGSTDVDGCDAVVNLAGESIAQRWTEAAKARILDSRVLTTRALVGAMAAAKKKPAVLVNASAVGYYGPGQAAVDETSEPGHDFLSKVCQSWEAEARKAEELGVRVISLRFGVVLGKEGGALKKMLLPFKLGLGGRLGSGTQPFPWLHIADASGLIQWAVEHRDLNGAVNAVAPEFRTNAEFTEALGRALHRPAIIPVPAAALKLLLGEMSTMLLEGQSAVPALAQGAGYTFNFPKLQTALEDCVA